jgi:hypothetical protein
MSSEVSPDKRQPYSRIGVTGEDIVRLILNGLELVGEVGAVTSEDVGIPPVVHRLWLNSVCDAHMPPTDYVANILQQATTLRPTVSQYIFWVNSPPVRKELEEKFSAAPIYVMDINEAFRGHVLMARINLAISHRKYVLAGDIAKFMILERYGGLYADLGVQFDPRLVDLAQSADWVLFLDSGLFFQPALIGAKPDANIMKLWNRVLEQPECLSAVMLADAASFSAGHEIWMHGGVGFTAVFMMLAGFVDRVLALLPQGAALQTQSQGSWYQPGGKFGNAVLQESVVTHLDSRKHRRLTAKMAALQPLLVDVPELRRSLIGILVGLELISA